MQRSIFCAIFTESDRNRLARSPERFLASQQWPISRRCTDDRFRKVSVRNESYINH